MVALLRSNLRQVFQPGLWVTADTLKMIGGKREFLLAKGGGEAVLWFEEYFQGSRHPEMKHP
jgi:hypothetical protein